ncbi:MAG: response regulator [Lachnospiraceae bacterium]|nr:response regulator [Lachnospiraceae bacterium]
MMRNEGVKLNSHNDPVRIRMLDAIITYIEIMNCVTIFLFNTSGSEDGSVFLTLLVAFMVFAALIWIIVRMTENYNAPVMIFAYITQFVFMPAFFVFSGGVYSGTPFFLVGGFIIMFALLEGAGLLLGAILSSIWYVFVIGFVYYYPNCVDTSKITLGMEKQMLYGFMGTAVLAAMVAAVYGSFFRRISESIEESKRLIELNGKVKSKFLANTTMELKTPMNVILAMANTLERESDDETVKMDVSMIKKSSFSLLSMINNVLSYAAFESKSITQEKEQFHFGSFLKDLIYTVSMELSDKNVSLYTNIDPGIPDVLYGDVSRIRSVFKYILNNCIRNTQDGRIIMDVGYRINGDKNSVRIFVRIADTGEGFTDDEQKAIFNSFEIYDSRKYSQLKSAGLELTICRSILRLMNGNISIDSIDGIGTATTFDLEVYMVEKTPIVQVTVADDTKVLVCSPDDLRSNQCVQLLGNFSLVPDLVNTPAALESMLKDNKYSHIFVYDMLMDKVNGILTEYGYEDKTYVLTDYRHKFGDFSKMRILRLPINVLNLSEAFFDTWKSVDYLSTIDQKSFVAPDASILLVDNSMMDLHMLSSFMAKYEVRPTLAVSGREALDKCMLHSFDLILLNQSMPGMDGISTLDMIRDLPGGRCVNTPVICMSSTLGMEMKENLTAKGFQDILSKPVRSGPLENVIKTYLPQRLLKESLDDKKKEASDEPLLSVKKGLVHTGGDEKAYHDILNTYYFEGQDRMDGILRQYADQTWDLFEISVHAVKGSSAGVGAMTVSEAYRQLEMAAKEKDISFITSHLDKALNLYRDVLDEIKEYLISKDAFRENSQKKDLPLEEFDIDDMRRLKEYLDGFMMMQLEEELARLKEHNYGEEINSFISGINRACELYDYDRAMELVGEFLEIWTQKS